LHISGVAVLELIRISIHAADRDFKTCYQQAEKKRNYFDKQIIPPNNEESIQIYADIDQEPDGDVWLFCCQKLIGGIKNERNTNTGAEGNRA